LAALHKGDPCFDTPQHIAEAASRAVRDGYTHYPSPAGDRELRAALADHTSNRAARSYSPTEILITAGATEGLYCALTAFLDSGDEALLFDPAYSGYAPVIRQAGATPVFVQTTTSFRLDIDRLVAAITPRTRLLLINNPSNPTGVVFRRDELDAIAEIAVEHDLLVVSDEVYDHLVFTNEGFARSVELPELVDRLIYVNSFSKTYAMTGWRLGWMAAPRQLLDGPETIHRNCVGQVSWPTQRAGLAALSGSMAPVNEMVHGYQARRSEMVSRLEQVPGLVVLPAEGAFYAFVEFKVAGDMSSSLLTKKLHDAGVAVRSGSEYGPAGEGHLRLSYSASWEDIRTGVERIGTVMSELAGEPSRS
jgi:aspartate aminotransferase